MAKIKIAEIPDFDAAELLTDDLARAGYLDLSLQTSDLEVIADSLGDVVRSIRMSRLKGGGELARQDDEKVLKVGRNPRLSTLLEVMREIGMELRVGPAKSDASLLHRRRRGTRTREAS